MAGFSFAPKKVAAVTAPPAPAAKAPPAPVAAKPTKAELTARLDGARQAQVADPDSYINSSKYTVAKLVEAYNVLSTQHDLTAYAPAIEWFLGQIKEDDDAKKAAKAAAASAPPAPKAGRKAPAAAPAAPPAPARAPLPTPALPAKKGFSFKKAA